MKLKNTVLLFLTVTIWGFAFVAQSVGMDYVGPLTFNCVRSLIGSAVLLPCIWFFNRRAGKTEKKKKAEDGSSLLLGGLLCGAVLCIASNLQQIAIQDTTVGKAGFITACYIVIVPVMGGLFLHKKCSPVIGGAVALSLAGLYLLCITGDEGGINQADVLLFLSAVMFSIHILLIDHFAPKVDGVKLSCIQFLISGLLSGIGMFAFEEPQMGQIIVAWAPILYAGALSCGVAYTFQILGQEGADPTVASLILSLESCMSVLAGWLILGERLSARELSGCVLMFAAIVLAQLPMEKILGKRRQRLG